MKLLSSAYNARRRLSHAKPAALLITFRSFANDARIYWRGEKTGGRVILKSLA